MRTDHDRQWCISSRVFHLTMAKRTDLNETFVDGIRSRNETARNEAGELDVRRPNLVVGIHDGFRMRCA